MKRSVGGQPENTGGSFDAIAVAAAVNLSPGAADRIACVSAPHGSGFLHPIIRGRESALRRLWRSHAAPIPSARYLTSYDGALGRDWDKNKAGGGRLFLAYIGARGYNRHSQKCQGDKNRSGCVLAFAESKRPHGGA